MKGFAQIGLQSEGGSFSELDPGPKGNDSEVTRKSCTQDGRRFEYKMLQVGQATDV